MLHQKKGCNYMLGNENFYLFFICSVDWIHGLLIQLLNRLVDWNFLNWIIYVFFYVFVLSLKKFFTKYWLIYLDDNLWPPCFYAISRFIILKVSSWYHYKLELLHNFEMEVWKTIYGGFLMWKKLQWLLDEIVISLTRYSLKDGVFYVSLVWN